MSFESERTQIGPGGSCATHVHVVVSRDLAQGKGERKRVFPTGWPRVVADKDYWGQATLEFPDSGSRLVDLCPRCLQ